MCLGDLCGLGELHRDSTVYILDYNLNWQERERSLQRCVRYEFCSMSWRLSKGFGLCCWLCLFGKILGVFFVVLIVWFNFLVFLLLNVSYLRFLFL